MGTGNAQSQANIDEFAYKISKGKQAQVTEDFMVDRRVESLVLGKGVDDALTRAQAYIEAGADAIMIHSAAKVPDEILTFCRRYQELDLRMPIVAYRHVQRDDRNGSSRPRGSMS